MSDNCFSLAQKAFPGIKKTIDVDLEGLKIRVLDKNLFKQKKYSIDLYEVSETPFRLSKKSIEWLVFSLCLFLFSGLGFLLLLIPWLSVLCVILMVSCSFIGGLLAWHAYYENSADELIYTSRYHASDHELFRLHFENTKEYHHFVARLDDVLNSVRKGKDLRVMIEQTPKKILLEEFRTSYIEELLKREIDVVHFLDNLQEYYGFKQAPYIPNRYLN